MWGKDLSLNSGRRGRREEGGMEGRREEGGGGREVSSRVNALAVWFLLVDTILLENHSIGSDQET